MYVRELKNRSGSISIQIISKGKGRYKVVRSLDSATQLQEIDKLKQKARQQIREMENQLELFESRDDKFVEQVFETLQNSSIRTVGPELVFGRIFVSLRSSASCVGQKA